MTDKWFRMDDPDNPPPKDGSWFVILVDRETPEVGRYNPLIGKKYEPVGENLFRSVEVQVYDWDGFNNFHAATHWIPLPEAPND